MSSRQAALVWAVELGVARAAAVKGVVAMSEAAKAEPKVVAARVGEENMEAAMEAEVTVAVVQVVVGVMAVVADAGRAEAEMVVEVAAVVVMEPQEAVPVGGGEVDSAGVREVVAPVEASEVERAVFRRST